MEELIRLCPGSNIRIDGLESDSKYVSVCEGYGGYAMPKSLRRDAFWEVENVTIYDSELNGEYLGWHSRRSSVSELSHYRRTAALLCLRPRVGELHLRPRL
ncbi:MAG: DUF3737 family protein [Parabacteroides merdae]